MKWTARVDFWRIDLWRIDHWVACLGIAAPCLAPAASWTLESDAAVSSEYNDNQRLTSEQQEAVWGRHADLDMRILGATPKSDFRLNPKYRLSRFSSAEELDSDVAAMAMSTRLLGERVVSELSLDWRRDTTLTSELEDTGLVQTNKNRITRGAHPYIQYAITERMEGQLRWDYTDVAYEDASLTGLTDYSHRSLAGTLVFKRSSRDSLQADMYASRLDAPEIGNQVMDVGARASFTHAFYERSYGTFTIGAHRVETTQELPGPDFQITRHGFLGSVLLTQERARTTWKAQAQRTIDPSGYGTLVQNDRFDLAVTERLSPYWTIRLDGLYLQNDVLQSPVAFDSRRYARLMAQAFRSLSEEWRVSLRYAYQWQKYASAARGADSNEIGINIAYRFDTKTLYP
jgi:hypothetical protein